MSTLSKSLKAAAGNAGGDAPNVADVFSTYLYEGTGSSHTITNGIDLAGEGGLTWLKWRSGTNAFGHALFDTERGSTKQLVTNSTTAESTESRFTSFNSDGFTLSGDTELDYLGDDYASWTFRKAPRFFDVVTYTGDGVAGRTIAHDLECDVGMLVIKKTSSGGDWRLWHRGAPGKGARLNEVDGFSTGHYPNFDSTAPTDTHFIVGSQADVNELNGSYVAYVFAHDPVGEDNDGMIACGSYTGNGSTTGPVIALGWEPQYVMIKRSTSAGNWFVSDTIRGTPTGGFTTVLKPNISAAEQTAQVLWNVTPTGFKIVATESEINASGNDYIYMAIRKSNKIPKSSDEVFDMALRTGTGGSVTVPLNITPDFVISANRGAWYKGVFSRGYETNPVLVGVSQNTAGFYDNNIRMDTSDGIIFGADPTLKLVNKGGDNYIYYAFKQTRGFLDKIDYSGSGSSRTLSHNLGVVPEMMWFTRHDSGSTITVWHKGTPANNHEISLSSIGGSSPGVFSSSSPTDTELSIPGAFFSTNNLGDTYTAILFATAAGVSKVGSYTGNGSSQTISCGFSTGARFLLIKRIDSNGSWYIWDTERGIVADNDPHLSMEAAAAEVTTDDSIDPQSAGFTVNQVTATNINVTSATYIFLAIA
jgi:hypothetical protein